MQRPWIDNGSDDPQRRDSHGCTFVLTSVNLSSLSPRPLRRWWCQAPGAPLPVFHARSQQRLWDERVREAEQHGHAELVHAVPQRRVRSQPALRPAVPGDGGKPPPSRQPHQVQRPAGPRKDASELWFRWGDGGQQAAGAGGCEDPAHERAHAAESHFPRRQPPLPTSPLPAIPTLSLRQRPPPGQRARGHLSVKRKAPPESQGGLWSVHAPAEPPGEPGPGVPEGPVRPVPPDCIGPGSAECLWGAMGTLLHWVRLVFHLLFVLGVWQRGLFPRRTHPPARPPAIRHEWWVTAQIQLVRPPQVFHARWQGTVAQQEKTKEQKLYHFLIRWGSGDRGRWEVRM